MKKYPKFISEHVYLYNFMLNLTKSSINLHQLVHDPT